MGRSRKGLARSLGAGVDPNLPDSQGWTPLHWSAYLNDRESIKLLEASGASVDRQDFRGWTAREVSIFIGARDLFSARRQSLIDSIEDEPPVGVELSLIHI